MGERARGGLNEFTRRSDPRPGAGGRTSCRRGSTYGLGGAENHRLRGARVFRLDESVEGICAGTELRHAADYGIDLTAGTQPGEPAEFPGGVG